MHPMLRRSGLALMLLVVAAPAMGADEPTRYRIRNRWLADQFLNDSGGAVGYGPAEGAATLWTLEDSGGLKRIRNVATGGSMVAAEAGPGVATAQNAPDSPRGRWEVEVGVAPWSSIRNEATGKYVNIEHKLGRAEADGANLPAGDNWWSGQWELVHAGGPPPPPSYRRHRVSVTSPAYGSDVRGDVTVSIRGPGLASAVARCWQAGAGFGSDSVVAEVRLDAEGRGSFPFPADKYPHGPITVRIAGQGGEVRDNCYLQLYNKGGISWHEGIPKSDPPAARGMKLLFADDFNRPLSISSTDPRATYYDHKPPGGYQDFSTLTFRGHESPEDPFSQVETYLRIRADERKKSAGLISSLKNDGTGIKAALPCYFECRMIGPNAVGTWPAFWLMTDYLTDYQVLGDKTPCDELDIVEAYGGEGPGSPNADDTYMVTPHCWNQGEAGKALEKLAFDGLKNPAKMRKLGVPSTWFEAFHTFGCKVTETDTTYYCDDREVGRHATFPVTKTRPLFFMINLATGGGWPVDLSRYDGRADMYVDYVRVYQ